MTAEMIVTESRELMQLTPQMQRHVDRTLAADRKGGEALWEKALAVSDARAEAKHGDWQAYLGATGMEERAARRLIGIADRGRSEGRFREAIISGWLSFSVAAIAAKADDDLLTGLLSQPTPPTYAQITASANPATLPDLKPAQRITIAPTNPLDSVAEALRKNNTTAAYAAVNTINNLDDRKRAFAAVDARLDGKSVATVLAMLEPPTRIKIATDKGMEEVTPIRSTDHIALCVLDGKYSITHIGTGYRVGELITSQKEADALFDQAVNFSWSDISGNVMGDTLRSQIKTLFPPEDKKIDPVLSAFPPGHVEAGIGMLERRLKEGTTQLAEDMQWADKFRTELNAARTGMKPEVYGTWSARLDSARDALVRLEAHQRKPIRCAHCGSAWLVLIGLGRFCQSCYSLTEAQKWPVGSEDARWRLKQALTAAEAMQDATIRAGRIAEIRDVADAWKIDLDAPIIEAPQAAPVKKIAAKSQAVLRQHAEALLAGIIERCTPAELRLMHAVICPDPPSSDVSGDVWEAGKEILDLDSTDLDWIEKG